MKIPREDQGAQVPAATLNRVLSGSTAPNDNSGAQWFGPGRPLNPIAPREVAGRQFDFPVHHNVAQRPRAYDSVSFEQLRALAENYDLLRLVIETRKDQVESYQWEIRAKEGRTVSDEAVKEIHDFFQFPDKEHPWGQWVRMLLEDIFVIDAAVVYPRETRGGDLYSLELIDGGTIKRVLDPSGRTPLPPDVAYQQQLKGLPAVDYTRDELSYWMRNPRTWKVYGYSPVEQVIMTVQIAMRRQIHQLQYYTEGNVPEMIMGVPETWSMETLKEFQTWWDGMMEGNTAARRHMKFVPAGVNSIPVREAPMKDLFDEWLARIICFAFSISPTALVKETNRATAESVQDAAKSEGVVPILNYLKALFDYLIQFKLGNADVEFAWKVDTELDPKSQAEVDQIYLQNKVITPDEVRERIGMAPLTPEQQALLNPPPPPQLAGFQGKPGEVVPGEGDEEGKVPPVADDKGKAKPPKSKAAAEATTDE
jgi:hypothetical protein